MVPRPFQQRIADWASKVNGSKGRKRRFGIAGIANLAATNILLQMMLSTNLFSTSFCTLMSQILNASLGYLLYGKIVFEADDIRSHKPMLKYMIMSLAIWGMNTACIQAGSLFNISRNVSALAIIPFLALASYIIQKKWIFP